MIGNTKSLDVQSIQSPEGSENPPAVQAEVPKPTETIESLDSKVLSIDHKVTRYERGIENTNTKLTEVRAKLGLPPDTEEVPSTTQSRREVEKLEAEKDELVEKRNKLSGEIVDKTEEPKEAASENVVPRDIDSLTTKLKDYFYSQDDPALQKNKEIYLKNVNASEQAMSLIENHPDYFDHLFYLLSERVLSPEEMGVLAHNFQERQGEISKNEKDRHDRIVANPQATDEEYELGAYAESIESQVRGATFDLQKKGYRPMESGFLDLVEGSQYIGIVNGEGVNPESIKDSLVNPVDEDIKKLFQLLLKNISVDVLDKHGRIQIVLVPKDRELTLTEWKKIWDYVAQCIPDIKDKQSKKSSDNGNQGMEFRETQNKIKEGKNAWLKSNLAFVNGKVVSMSYQDFMNLEKSS